VVSNLTGIAESQVTNLVSDLATINTAIATKATDTAVVHLAGTESITGAKTFTAGSGAVGLVIKAATNANALNIQDNGGTVRSSFDKDAYGFPRDVVFSLSPGVNLSAGANLFGKVIAPYAGKIVKWKAVAETNPSGSGGGFTFDIKLNGASIFSAPISVAAGTTTVQTGNTFASTAIAENDLLQCDISSPGTNVQGVKIVLCLQTRNN
jgi:hypothetical protein